MREYSIKKNTLIIFLFIISVMLSGFYYFDKIGKNNLKNYKSFIDINKKANKLLFLLDDCEKNINRYFNTKNTEHLDNYLLLSEEINKYLNELDEFGNSEKEVLVYLQKSDNTRHYQEVLYYLRMVKNMNNYQMQMVEDIREDMKSNLNPVRKKAYLNNYFIEMNSNTKLFIQAYFNFTGIIFDSYYEESEKLGKDISFLVTILTIIGFILTTLYLLGFIKIINQFEKTSRDLSLRIWNTEDISLSRYYELNQVSKTINNMKHAIIDYIEELESKSKLEIQLNNEKLIRMEQEKLLHETKLLSLQMKMNPHFLFNTLNLIGSTAISCNAELATELIEAISEILRYNLEYDEKNVSLQVEIAMIEKYIFIQKTRWQDRINFSIINEIPEENIKIPPMLIQPLIENSIIHGLKNIIDKGIITVSFRKELSDIVVSVFDNGSGIEKEKLEKIFKEDNYESEKKRSSIGLKNIRKRMEMLYNRKDLLKINSLEEGTLISLSFPIERTFND